MDNIENVTLVAKWQIELVSSEMENGHLGEEICYQRFKKQLDFYHVVGKVQMESVSVI